MTTEENLDALVGNSFLAANKSKSIILAQDYFGVSNGDSDGADMAVALLAHANLLNQRLTEKGKTNDSIIPKTLEELVTPKMERLLQKSGASDKYKLIRTVSPSSTNYRG